MSKLKQVAIVTLKEDYKRYEKGQTVAMHFKLAEKLKKLNLVKVEADGRESENGENVKKVVKSKK